MHLRPKLKRKIPNIQSDQFSMNCWNVHYIKCQTFVSIHDRIVDISKWLKNWFQSKIFKLIQHRKHASIHRTWVWFVLEKWKIRVKLTCSFNIGCCIGRSSPWSMRDQCQFTKISTFAQRRDFNFASILFNANWNGAIFYEIHAVSCVTCGPTKRLEIG